MSRIGNNPISVPDGVDIDIQPTLVTVKGKLGELTQEYSEVEIKMEENIIYVTRLPKRNLLKLNTAYIVLLSSI